MAIENKEQRNMASQSAADSPRSSEGTFRLSFHRDPTGLTPRRQVSKYSNKLPLPTIWTLKPHPRRILKVLRRHQCPDLEFEYGIWAAAELERGPSGQKAMNGTIMIANIEARDIIADMILCEPYWCSLGASMVGFTIGIDCSFLPKTQQPINRCVAESRQQRIAEPIM